jgi:HSP20 family protein
MNTLNTLTTWNPLQGIENLGTLQNRLNRAFGRSLLSLDEDMSYSSDWLPAIDIAEDEKEYTVKADLPDVKREDVHVTLRNGSISLTGERRREKEDKGKTYHRIERSYGKFERTFTLPENTTSENIKAEFKGGTLQIHLPKTKESPTETKEITIS